MYVQQDSKDQHVFPFSIEICGILWFLFFFFRSLNIYSAFESIRQLRRTMILERFTEILNENRLGCVISMSTADIAVHSMLKRKKNLHLRVVLEFA